MKTKFCEEEAMDCDLEDYDLLFRKLNFVILF